MEYREQIIIATKAYCEATGLSRTHVSKQAFGRGTKLDDLEFHNKTMSIETYQRGKKWLSDNWPAGFDWPEGVERPAPKAEAV